MQLLALLAVILAVARPYIRVIGVSENKIIVVLDTSASMQSTDVSPSRFECANDTIAENNVALGYTRVKGKPRILYVEGEAGRSKYLANVLKSNDIEADVRDRSGVPDSLAKMSGYDAIILSDVTGGIGRVTIDAADENGEFMNLLNFTGSVIGPDAGVHPLVVEQTGPGRYEAAFDAGKTGSYIINITKKGRSNAVPDVDIVSIPYSPEYKDVSPNLDLLRRLASESSGRFDPKLSDAFAGGFRETKAYTDLWRLCLLLAAVMLPLDVAVRRLTMGVEQVAELYDRASKSVLSRITLSKRSTKAESVETVGLLLKAKRESRQAKHTPITQLGGQDNSRTPTTPTIRPDIKPSDAPADEEDITSRLLRAKRRGSGNYDNSR